MNKNQCILSESFGGVQKRTAWERFKQYVLPERHAVIPMTDFVASDHMIQSSVVDVDFTDRLRLLFTGRLMLKTITLCENKPGKLESSGVFYVLPPKGWK